jgi:stage V sporulation protein AB
MNVLQNVLLALIGLGVGLAVGSGLIAFITVLDIIPRLTQLTNSQRFVKRFEWGLVSGALSFTLLDFFQVGFQLPVWVTSVLGLFAGIFVGMLAAGLTEVLNVFPILAKRLLIDHAIFKLLMAMVLGKTIGSLIQWLLRL